MSFVHGDISHSKPGIDHFDASSSEETLAADCLTGVEIKTGLVVSAGNKVRSVPGGIHKGQVTTYNIIQYSCVEEPFSPHYWIVFIVDLRRERIQCNVNY